MTPSVTEVPVINITRLAQQLEPTQRQQVTFLTDMKCVYNQYVVAKKKRYHTLSIMVHRSDMAFTSFYDPGLDGVTKVWYDKRHCF